MNACAPIHWDVRPPGWTLLVKGALQLAAGAAIAYAAWPWFQGNAAAYGVLSVILALGLLRRFTAPGRAQPVGLCRIEAGHWLLHYSDGSRAACTVQTVWRAGGWITLQLRPVAAASPRLTPAASGRSRPSHVTLWRSKVPASAWHGLCLWSSWETTMARRLHKGVGA